MTFLKADIIISTPDKEHPLVISTEAEKGQPKNILQIQKNILNRNVFSKINVEEFVKSKKKNYKS